ncbi:FecR family protein [Bosea sp. (in: a-proteobacteria)]|uniref:FecR family protein n=1 Tax=Bosea sp. (in: a-proteobacteria) TaxID=1871050 RepID=UPI003F6E84EC
MQDERDTILDQAAEWYMRRDAGGFTAAEGLRLRTWLAADPRHREAFDEIEVTWSLMGHAAFDDRPRAAPAPPAWRRQLMVATAIAASIVLGIGYLFDIPTRLRADAYTATGETRLVRLDDGSTVMLDTASAIAVDYTQQARRIRLLGGEAVFTVAPDTGRPFLVESQNGESRALGTAFAVRDDGAGATVTVLESKVGVALPDRQAEIRLTPGQQVSYTSLGLGPVEQVDADVETAWRRGKLIFVDKPLGSVVDALNRYHRGRIQITDAAIRSRPVSGVFEIGDPLRVLDALEASLDLRSTRLTSYLVLLHR